MSKNIKGNHKHLTLSDRIFIEQSLNDHIKFNAIAKALEKDPSTISNEVVRSMEIKPIPHYKGNDCIFLFQFSDMGRNNSSSVMFCYFMIDGINLLVIPSTIMNYSCFTAIRYKILGMPLKYSYIWTWAVIHACCFR